MLAIGHGCEVTLLNQKTLCMFRHARNICTDDGGGSSSLGGYPSIARPSGVRHRPSIPHSARPALHERRASRCCVPGPRNRVCCLSFIIREETATLIDLQLLGCDFDEHFMEYCTAILQHVRTPDRDSVAQSLIPLAADGPQFHQGRNTLSSRTFLTASTFTLSRNARSAIRCLVP